MTAPRGLICELFILCQHVFAGRAIQYLVPGFPNRLCPLVPKHSVPDVENLRTKFDTPRHTKKQKTLTIKSLTGPRFFFLTASSCLQVATHYEQATKTLCRCRNFRGLAKTELTPSLVPSLLGTKTQLAKGWDRGKAFNY